MMTQKGKVREILILRIAAHPKDVEAGGAILKMNSNLAIIPQDGEGAIAAKNQVPATLPQNHLLHGGDLEE